MKISQIIPLLKEFQKIYGDCELTKLDDIGLSVVNIDEIRFIGASRILLISDTLYDTMGVQNFKKFEEKINQKRKQEWMKDCEG